MFFVFPDLKHYFSVLYLLKKYAQTRIPFKISFQNWTQNEWKHFNQRKYIFSASFNTHIHLEDASQHLLNAFCIDVCVMQYVQEDEVEPCGKIRTGPIKHNILIYGKLVTHLLCIFNPIL